MNSGYKQERSKLGDRHFRAGKALTGVNDLSGAAEEFRKALLFAPDNKEYELSLAAALVSSGRFEEAESHLEQLAQEDPTNGNINLLLARVARSQHHNREAMASYQRAVYEYWPPEKFADRRQARWELIDLLKKTGQHRDQLVGELLQLYGNLPPHSDQRIQVASYLLASGADAEAAHVFRDILKDAAVESPPEGTANQVRAHSGLARVAFRAGDFVEARHEYQRVLRVAPDDLATASALELTNDIIDMAPQLPNISPSERLRRSKNVLNRVEGDLRHCAEALDQKTPGGTAQPGQGVQSGSPETPPNGGKPASTPSAGVSTDDSQACTGLGPASCALVQRLQEVRQTTPKKAADKDDEAALLQQTAEELWKERARFCGQNHVSDPALEAVLPRLEHD